MSLFCCCLVSTVTCDLRSILFFFVLFCFEIQRQKGVSLIFVVVVVVAAAAAATLVPCWLCERNRNCANY